MVAVLTLPDPPEPGDLDLEEVLRSFNCFHCPGIYVHVIKPVGPPAGFFRLGLTPEVTMNPRERLLGVGRWYISRGEPIP